MSRIAGNMQHDSCKITAGRRLIRRPQGITQMHRRDDNQPRGIKPQHRQPVGIQTAGIKPGCGIGNPYDSATVMHILLRQHAQQHPGCRPDGAAFATTPLVKPP